MKWNGRNGAEEIPSLYSPNEVVNNNFLPTCYTDTNKWFEAKHQIRVIDGHQRLVCSVRILGSTDSSDYPDSFSLYLIDNHNI